MPGVEAVGLVEQLPLLGRNTENLSLPRDGAEGDAAWRYALTSGVAIASSEYFAAMNLRLLRGRAFDDRLANEGDRGAVVSASTAAALWPDSEPIGRRFRAANHVYTVTGVAADARMTSLASATPPFVYLAAPTTSPSLQIVVRASGSMAAVERAVPELARAIDPQIGVRAERFEDRFATALAPARVGGIMAGAAGTLALVLALVGIYGVVSYSVGQRANEIAVRLALGASRAGVIAIVVRQGARPVVAGILTGMVMAALASRALRGVLFGISPLDPLSYAVVPVVLAAGALLAMYAPARRASRVDPAEVLRES